MMKLQALVLSLNFIFATTLAVAQLASDSILIDGNYRSFYFNKPASVNKGKSLVFILHGSGGSGLDMAKKAGNLEQRSGKENFLVVYPNGYKKYWNECRKAAS